jgi:hypothetical protein
MSTKYVLKTFRDESDKNHLTVLGELKAVSSQVSQLADTGFKQRAPLIEDSESRSLIQRKVSESSAAISQSVVTEMDQRLLALEGSLVNSLAQLIDNSRKSVEARVTSSSDQVTSTLSMHTRQQTLDFASIFNDISEYQRQDYTEQRRLELDVFRWSLPRSKKRQKQSHDLVNQKPSGCQCNPNTGRVNRSPAYRWGIGKESELFIIHKRNCPLWYHSQVVTNYSIDIVLLQRLRIFGSLNIHRRPYASSFGWSITQNLTSRAIVPGNAPAFMLLWKYLMRPEFHDDENLIENCFVDLQAVFQSGQGSPYDMTRDGTTLIEVSFHSRLGRSCTRCLLTGGRCHFKFYWDVIRLVMEIIHSKLFGYGS